MELSLNFTQQGLFAYLTINMWKEKVEITVSNSAIMEKSWMHIVLYIFFLHNPAQSFYRFYSAERCVHNSSY